MNDQAIKMAKSWYEHWRWQMLRRYANCAIIKNLKNGMIRSNFDEVKFWRKKKDSFSTGIRWEKETNQHCCKLWPLLQVVFVYSGIIIIWWWRYIIKLTFDLLINLWPPLTNRQLLSTECISWTQLSAISYFTIYGSFSFFFFFFFFGWPVAPFILVFFFFTLHIHHI